MKYFYYPYLMGVCILIAIGLTKIKSATNIIGGKYSIVIKYINQNNNIK